MSFRELRELRELRGRLGGKSRKELLKGLGLALNKKAEGLVRRFGQPAKELLATLGYCDDSDSGHEETSNGHLQNGEKRYSSGVLDGRISPSVVRGKGKGQHKSAQKSRQD